MGFEKEAMKSGHGGHYGDVCRAPESVNMKVIFYHSLGNSCSVPRDGANIDDECDRPCVWQEVFVLISDSWMSGNVESA